MKVGIKINGEWLSVYDPEMYSGRGYFETTSDPHRAIRFANAAQALAFSRQQLRMHPLRRDGKPNRPLTGYAILIEKIPNNDN